MKHSQGDKAAMISLLILAVAVLMMVILSSAGLFYSPLASKIQYGVDFGEVCHYGDVLTGWISSDSSDDLSIVIYVNGTVRGGGGGQGYVTGGYMVGENSGSVSFAFSANETTLGSLSCTINGAEGSSEENLSTSPDYGNPPAPQIDHAATERALQTQIAYAKTQALVNEILNYQSTQAMLSARQLTGAVMKDDFLATKDTRGLRTQIVQQTMDARRTLIAYATEQAWQKTVQAASQLETLQAVEQQNAERQQTAQRQTEQTAKELTRYVQTVDASQLGTKQAQQKTAEIRRQTLMVVQTAIDSQKTSAIQQQTADTRNTQQAQQRTFDARQSALSLTRTAWEAVIAEMPDTFVARDIKDNLKTGDASMDYEIAGCGNFKENGQKDGCTLITGVCNPGGELSVQGLARQAAESMLMVVSSGNKDFNFGSNQGSEIYGLSGVKLPDHTYDKKAMIVPSDAGIISVYTSIKDINGKNNCTTYELSVPEKALPEPTGTPTSTAAPREITPTPTLKREEAITSTPTSTNTPLVNPPVPKKPVIINPPIPEQRIDDKPPAPNHPSVVSPDVRPPTSDRPVVVPSEKEEPSIKVDPPKDDSVLIIEDDPQGEKDVPVTDDSGSTIIPGDNTVTKDGIGNEPGDEPEVMNDGTKISSEKTEVDTNCVGLDCNETGTVEVLPEDQLSVETVPDYDENEVQDGTAQTGRPDLFGGMSGHCVANGAGIYFARLSSQKIESGDKTGQDRSIFSIWRYDKVTGAVTWIGDPILPDDLEADMKPAIRPLGNFIYSVDSQNRLVRLPLAGGSAMRLPLAETVESPLPFTIFSNENLVFTRISPNQNARKFASIQYAMITESESLPLNDQMLQNPHYDYEKGRFYALEKGRRGKSTIFSIGLDGGDLQRTDIIPPDLERWQVEDGLIYSIKEAENGYSIWQYPLDSTGHGTEISEVLPAILFFSVDDGKLTVITGDPIAEKLYRYNLNSGKKTIEMDLTPLAADKQTFGLCDDVLFLSSWQSSGLLRLKTMQYTELEKN